MHNAFETGGTALDTVRAVVSVSVCQTERLISTAVAVRWHEGVGNMSIGQCYHKCGHQDQNDRLRRHQWVTKFMAGLTHSGNMCRLVY
jgi:hypothetical protein